MICFKKQTIFTKSLFLLWVLKRIEHQMKICRFRGQNSRKLLKKSISQTMHFSIGFSYRFGWPGTIKIDGLRRVLAGFWGSWEGSWNDFLNDFFINCCPHASGRHLGPFWCHFEGFGQGRRSQGPSKLMVCGGLWQDIGGRGLW